jgi:hypothetical protein
MWQKKGRPCVFTLTSFQTQIAMHMGFLYTVKSETDHDEMSEPEAKAEDVNERQDTSVCVACRKGPEGSAGTLPPLALVHVDAFHSDDDVS